MNYCYCPRCGENFENTKNQFEGYCSAWCLKVATEEKTTGVSIPE